MIGKNTAHDSAISHVTGKSVFIDDRATLSNEIFVGLVRSPVAKGILNNIDSSEARLHEDFLGVWSGNDFIQKKWGTIVHDQPFAVEKEISYADEVIAIFASKTRESIKEIEAKFKLDITEQKPILSIDEAIAAESILVRATSPFVRGEVDSILNKAKHRLSGTFKCKGQEHFYMESQAAITYPLENGQIEVHSSSQHPSETQRVVAEALGLPLHHVTCVVKRMGGGFGGKESQGAPIAAYAALVTQKLNLPARIVLTKDDDMKITGKRHPFQNDYDIAFDEDGKILAAKMILRSDGGAYTDLSGSILERGMFHADGAYYLENCFIDGICYKTNTHPNTAYRGFGGPQGNMTIESIIEDIAQYLGKDSYEIRTKNIYREGFDLTPYGQKVENNLIPKLFQDLYKTADYQRRVEEIKKFNSENHGVLKGLSMTATKFGIAFTARFLNQGNALVNLHLDGTLQVSTGATEMGQGVNTKIGQIVANAFGVDIKDVQLMPTSTEKNHNTSATAASSGSDINGAAALKASNKIKARLTALAKLHFQGDISSELKELVLESEELDEKIQFLKGEVIDTSSGKVIPLKELINLAYFNRISLGDYAHFSTKGLGFSKTLVEGRAFNYFTQGVAVSEVSVCEYTGESKVLRTDIYMDLGRSLNPGIDEGQVAGAFVQAQGWVTTENLFYSDDGHLKTYSPTTYKIPNIQDTPRSFHISFIENNDNDCNVHRSKAVGEPPFVLGISVWTAIKNALSYRSEKNIVNIISPATNEVVLNELERLKNV